MDYYAHVDGCLDGDIKFKAVIADIMDFASEQLYKFGGVFKTHERYNEIRNGIEYQFEHPVARNKINVLYDVERMIYYLPPPKVKKVVREYFDARMTAYCNSLRGYANEIPGYPYKSDNIVDLLEEVETVKKEKQESFVEGFSPKPFVFDTWNHWTDNVYLPRTDVWVDKEGCRNCLCVHTCKKFLTYPVLKTGVRVIPYKEECNKAEHRHTCHGSYVIKNGVNTDISESLQSRKVLYNIKKMIQR